MSITVYGAGAIGGAIGASMARGGEDVLLVDKVAAHVDAINAHGLRISGFQRYTVPVRACVPADLRGPLGITFLAVKSQDTDSALDVLAPLAGPEIVVVSLQNGMNPPRIAERLFKDDLFSGWGLRTLSSNHPSYNPYSYHLGSIWPVEHGTFALGLMRYGLHDRVQQLARAQFEAASLFDFYRLPELFGGHPRDAAHPFPAMYPNANSPQAWSASATFSLLQALLGLYPYAPLNLLVVDPHLPDWLPEITIRDLRVGAAKVTIRFHGNSWDVKEKEGTLHVVQQPLPWSLTATWPERVVDLLKSLVK